MTLASNAPDLTKSEMEHGEIDDLKMMQRDMERKINFVLKFHKVLSFQHRKNENSKNDIFIMNNI